MTSFYYTNPSDKTITLSRFNSFLLLFFVSAAVLATANGIIQLPESYRTPLSDMVHEHHQHEWRAESDEDNPWREGEEELIIKPRIRTEFFPKWDYDTMDDPTTRSLFQNEYEIERPRTNIFKYTF
ncbi:MAG: hypothetical protein ACC650_04375 [Gammaproteobacteria bacterium]